jgi:hypothetical protein
MTSALAEETFTTLPKATRLPAPGPSSLISVPDGNRSGGARSAEGESHVLGNSPVVEIISSNGAILAYLIRGGEDPHQTTFPVPAEVPLQVGFVVYPAGGEVARHEHLAVERHLDTTCEVLVVRKGSCEIDVYDRRRRLVVTKLLEQDDVILLVAGGHGLRMSTDTVLLEVKQGPYTGLAEKERF